MSKIYQPPTSARGRSCASAMRPKDARRRTKKGRR